MLQEGLAWTIGSGTETSFWRDPLLTAWLPNEVVEEIKSIPIPISHLAKDGLIWKFTASGDFSTATAHNFLQGVSNPLCPGCGAAEESWIHMLRDCTHAMEVWNHFSIYPDFFKEIGSHWIKARATSKNGQGSTTPPADTLFMFTLWGIWKSRNLLIFEGQRPPPIIIAKTAAARAMEFHQARSSGGLIAPHQTAPRTNWSPPPEDFYKLNSDGSLKEGISTAGGIIRNHLGNWVSGFSMNIGPTSIKDAEL